MRMEIKGDKCASNETAARKGTRSLWDFNSTSAGKEDTKKRVARKGKGDSGQRELEMIADTRIIALVKRTDQASNAMLRPVQLVIQFRLIERRDKCQERVPSCQRTSFVFTASVSQAEYDRDVRPSVFQWFSRAKMEMNSFSLVSCV